jgi:sulfur carrier protein
MKVIINGESKEVLVATLSDLVRNYQLDENLIVTEVDGIIVNREERTSIMLQEGMKIEIVQFVGGG